MQYIFLFYSIKNWKFRLFEYSIKQTLYHLPNGSLILFWLLPGRSFPQQAFFFRRSVAPHCGPNRRVGHSSQHSATPFVSLCEHVRCHAIESPFVSADCWELWLLQGLQRARNSLHRVPRCHHSERGTHLRLVCDNRRVCSRDRAFRHLWRGCRREGRQAGCGVGANIYSQWVTTDEYVRKFEHFGFSDETVICLCLSFFYSRTCKGPCIKQE